MDYLRRGELKIYPVVFPNIKIKRFPEKSGPLAYSSGERQLAFVGKVRKISLISSVIHLLLS